MKNALCDCILTKVLTMIIFMFLTGSIVCGTSQKAYAEDWELDVGVGYVGESIGGEHKKTNEFSGLNLNVGFGHRMNKWLSLLNFEASFRIILLQCDCDTSNRGEPDPEFLGMSAFIAPKFYAYSSDRFDLYAKVGAGVIFPTSHRDADFGMRFGLGTTFYVNDWFGLGLDLDYDLSVLQTHEMVDNYGAGKQQGYINILFRMMFKL